MISRSYYIIKNKRPLRQYNNKYKPSISTKCKPLDKCLVWDNGFYAWLYHKKDGGFKMHHIIKTPPQHIIEKYYVGNAYNAIVAIKINLK